MSLLDSNDVFVKNCITAHFRVSQLSSGVVLVDYKQNMKVLWCMFAKLVNIANKKTYHYDMVQIQGRARDFFNRK